MFFQYRHKAGGSNSESILVSQLQHGLALEFEHSDPLRRLRLVLSELLAIMTKVSTYFAPTYLPTYLLSLKLFTISSLFIFVVQVADPNREFFLKSSELFESPVYLEEVADVLCILQAGDCSY